MLYELLRWEPTDVDIELLSAPPGAVSHGGYILMPDMVQRFEEIQQFHQQFGITPFQRDLIPKLRKQRRGRQKPIFNQQRTCPRCGKTFWRKCGQHQWCSVQCREAVRKGKDRAKSKHPYFNIR